MIIIHFTKHNHTDLGAFLGTPTTAHLDNAYKTLIKLGVASGTILIPHYHHDSLSHLQGKWKEVPRGQHPLERAYQAFYDIQHLISRGTSQRKIDFPGWLLFTPDGKGSGPPKQGLKHSPLPSKPPPRWSLLSNSFIPLADEISSAEGSDEEVTSCSATSSVTATISSEKKSPKKSKSKSTSSGGAAPVSVPFAKPANG